jgi:predicted metal-dependent phosphoesterase TrpH
LRGRPAVAGFRETREKMKYQNLHSHTTLSDGQVGYLETLDVCQQAGVGVVAFTDHDSLPTAKTLKLLSKNKNHPTKWIVGIEISSGLPRELGAKPTSIFHLVGLFVDPQNRKLKNFCQKMQAARIERMKKMVKNLAGLGFKITPEDCLAESEGKVVNRLHIVNTLFKRDNNLRLINEFKNRMRLASKNDSRIRKNYQKMIRAGLWQYPFKLFLDEKAFIQGIYVHHLYWLELDQSSQLIRQAGGLSILAHWTFYKSLIDEAMIGKLLKEKRVDGIEVVYNAHAPGLEEEVLADMKLVKKLAKKYQALESGGSDSHLKKDIIGFYKDAKLARKTEGLVQKMIQKSKIDLTWSSL